MMVRYQRLTCFVFSIPCVIVFEGMIERIRLLLSNGGIDQNRLVYYS